jgi:predicted DNA-binding transcriptional regulator AlpA
MPSEQLVFPFPSLDFPGRTAVTVPEVAAKLGVSDQTILNLVDDGSVAGLDMKGRRATKRCVRFPIEVYHTFVLSRLTGPLRGQFLKELPKATRLQLLRELQESLRATA